MRNVMTVPAASVGRRFGIALAAALLVFLTAPPVQAAHVQCGDVLTTDTTLDNDLFCVGAGFVVGADGITVDLKGHSIIRVGVGGFPNGIHNQGFDDVTILNGEITGFHNGVGLFGVERNLVTRLTLSNNTFSGVNVLRGNSGSPSSFSEISHLDITSSGRGVVLQGGAHDNVVAHNSIVDAAVFGIELFQTGEANELHHNSISDASSNGIQLVGSDATTIAHNSVSGAGLNGLLLANGSERNLIMHNEFTANIFSGVNLLSSSDWNVIRHNIMTSNGAGMLVQGGSDDSDVSHNVITDGTRDVGLTIQNSQRTRVSDNDVSRNPGRGISIFNSNDTTVIKNVVNTNGLDGVRVWSTSLGTFLKLNNASFNGDDGIDVDNATTTLRKNVANSNGDLGIEAVPGIVDDGKNTAQDNGNPAQCINISCG